MLGQLRPLVVGVLLLPVLCTEGAACTIVATSGTLGLTASGTVYTSELGLASLVTVASTLLDGPFTITIGQPSVFQSPTGFVPIKLEQMTSGSIGTNNMNFEYTTDPISRTFPAQLLGATVVTLHHRLTASAFPSGTYRTKTVVTCS